MTGHLFLPGWTEDFWQRYDRAPVTAGGRRAKRFWSETLLLPGSISRLREAIAGSGSLLVIEGPAGIGKTRLVLAAERHGRELGLTR